ncbi:MAG: polyhydroxyalkanoic acid system family protein [Pseudomonadota bacterium]
MSDPISVDIPHKLGLAGARARIDRGIGKLASFVPGGTVTEHRWEGDTLVFTLEAMGQRVASRLEVLETRIHASFDLPPMLRLFAGKIRDKLTRDGGKLLE